MAPAAPPPGSPSVAYRPIPGSPHHHATPQIVLEQYRFGVLHELGRKLGVLLKILSCSVLLSYFVPVGRALPEPWAKVSSLVGWTYFLLWTVSFYPQLITNWRRKSVEGLSLDYLALNVLGFVCYSVFNVAMVVSPQVKSEYQLRFGSVFNPVEYNDVFFSVHATAITLAMGVQSCVYERGEQRVHLGTWLGMALAAAGGGGMAASILLNGEGPSPLGSWLDLCFYCSWVKMGVTLIKCVPQVVMNCRRRSTAGWSLDNVLLDVGGGVLSISQLFMGCVLLRDWGAVTGNPVKLGLGLVSVMFDLLFILQHCVFAGAPATTPQRVEAAWFGSLALGAQGCGSRSCLCPCPRCRFVVSADASDLAATAVGSPVVGGWLASLAAQGQGFEQITRCMCVHGAASGYTPLASQYYRSASTTNLAAVALPAVYAALPDGYDCVI